MKHRSWAGRTVCLAAQAGRLWRWVPRWLARYLRPLDPVLHQHQGTELLSRIIAAGPARGGRWPPDQRLRGWRGSRWPPDRQRPGGRGRFVPGRCGGTVGLAMRQDHRGEEHHQQQRHDDQEPDEGIVHQSCMGHCRLPCPAAASLTGPAEPGPGGRGHARLSARSRGFRILPCDRG